MRRRRNRDRHALLHVRLAKVLTRAQKDAPDEGEARHGKECDAFRRERAPLRQSLAYGFQIHARIMAQPSFPRDSYGWGVQAPNSA